MSWVAWTNEEDLFLVENYEDMTNKELADELGRTDNAVGTRMQILGLKRIYLYACYEGENNVFTGTKKECAEYWDVKVETISFYNTQTYKRRIKGKHNSKVVVRI